MTLRSLANVLHYDANGLHPLAKAVLCLSSDMEPLIEFCVDLGLKYKDIVSLFKIKHDYAVYERKLRLRSSVLVQ